MKSEDIALNVGDIINDTYKLVRKISQGKRCTIFCAVDKQMQQVAIKAEKDIQG
ncbi:MAG: hypothetical protein EZS28_037149, partial [Streblomastix strix]